MELRQLNCAVRYSNSVEEGCAVVELYNNPYQMAMLFFLNYLESVKQKEELPSLDFLGSSKLDFLNLVDTISCDDCDCSIAYRADYFLRNCSGVIEPFVTMTTGSRKINVLTAREKDIPKVIDCHGILIKSITYFSDIDVPSKTMMKGECRYMQFTNVDGNDCVKERVDDSCLLRIVMAMHSLGVHSYFEMQQSLLKLSPLSGCSKEATIQAFNSMYSNKLAELALQGEFAENYTSNLTKVCSLMTKRIGGLNAVSKSFNY